MDIHKPKPWHGFREFLKEYLIIVVGVLTALGAEQVVEAVHIRHLASEAEALVREELARDVAFAREKAITTPCVLETNKLAQLTLLGTPTNRPVGGLKGNWFSTRPFTFTQWEAAVASGIAAHFPEERRLIYQRLYVVGKGGQPLNDLQTRQMESAVIVATLMLPPRRIDAQTRERLLAATMESQQDAIWVRGNAQNLVNYAEPLHLPAPKLGANTVLWTEEKGKACVDAILEQEATLPSLPGVDVR